MDVTAVSHGSAVAHIREGRYEIAVSPQGGGEFLEAIKGLRKAGRTALIQPEVADGPEICLGVDAGRDTLARGRASRDGTRLNVRLGATELGAWIALLHDSEMHQWSHTVDHIDCVLLMGDTRVDLVVKLHGPVRVVTADEARRRLGLAITREEAGSMLGMTDAAPSGPSRPDGSHAPTRRQPR